MTSLDLGFDQTLFNEVRRDVAGIVNDNLSQLVEDIIDELPRGVSPDGDSLASNFFLSPASLSTNDFTATVFSPLPFSTERLAGRGPGKPPPASKLEAWARSKGLNPYAVAKKIGQQGTQRWQEGESANVLRIDPRTKVIPTDKGLQKQATDRIVAEVEGLRY